MMRSAVIALFLIVFGAVSGMLGVSGMLPLDVSTDQTFTIDYATVQEITEGATQNEFNPVGAISSWANMLFIFLNSLVNALWFVPLLTSYGVPTFIAVCLQLPVWFVYIYDVMNWLGNRNPST